MAAKKQAEKLLASLGISKEIKLNEYEMLIASQLVEPRSITVSWKDVAGLENLVTELMENLDQFVLDPAPQVILVIVVMIQ